MTSPPDLVAFDTLFKDLSPEEKEKSKNLIRRYLEMVVRIADRERALTEVHDDDTL